MSSLFPVIVALLLLFLLALPAETTAAEKIIFDTDIGDDIDDAYALALLAAEPNINILGVTTCLGDTPKRSALAARLLKVMERAEIPVYTGRQTGNNVGRQHEWALGFRSRAIKSEDAVAFMRRELTRTPGEITLLAVGPLTNLGDLLTKHPEVKPHIKRIVLMGGSAYVGYDNKPPAKPEYNIFTNVAAAKAVFQSGVPIVMAGLDVTTMMQLDIERQRKIFAVGVPMTDALAALTKLWEQRDPTLFDPMAVAYAFGHKFCESERKRVEVNDVGLTQVVEGAPNVEVLIRPRKDQFLDWYVSRIVEFARSRPSGRPR
jgi:inosine-uridine nucleoside N-ribohydrolase